MEKNKKWHLSKYNLFMPLEEENKLACVNLFKKSYSEIALCDISKLFNFNQLEENNPILLGFIKQGIIVDFNELDYIKATILKEYSKNDSIGLTIAVTSACNFNCPYCFEIHKSFKKMSEEIENKILNFIKNLMNFYSCKKLHVTWYGGEPLLAIETIESLSKKIIEYINTNNFNYTSSIITNGYLLNQKNIDILEKYKVNFCQITLDGLKEKHNSFRYLINGDGTFDKIIENLYSIKTKMPISIRQNVNKDNEQDSEKLSSLIKNIKQKTGNNISFYKAIMINNPGEFRKENINYLNNDELYPYFDNGIKKNFFSNLCNIRCTASSLTSYCIDEEGNLCKCWEDIGKIDRYIGTLDTFNIFDPINSASNKDIFIKYLNSINGLDNKECKECIWLPYCCGGCPSKRMFYNIKCIPFKDNPDYFVKKIKELYTKNKKNKEYTENCEYKTN